MPCRRAAAAVPSGARKWPHPRGPGRLRDGSEFKKLEITYGEKEYILAENLEDKPHEVRLVRGTTAGSKAYTLKAAIIEDIADLEVGYEREYSCKLQILGDSITAGGLNMFTDTYGFKLSEQLNAQTIYNAIPGGKLYYETKSHVSISDMFESTEFYTLKDYDFEFQPDVVVLSSGFNDHGPWKRNTDPTYRANFEKAMEEKYFEFFCFVYEKITICNLRIANDVGRRDNTSAVLRIFFLHSVFS